MSFKDPRVTAVRLGSAAEALRMGYGQSSLGGRPDQLKKIFSDALRWQSQRILEDQVRAISRALEHAAVNSRYAEAWTFLSKFGVWTPWSLDNHEELVRQGWNRADAEAVAEVEFDLQTTSPISREQIETYVVAFDIERTSMNLAEMRRTICAAKAAGCRQATERLSTNPDVHADWTDDALACGAPFAWQFAAVDTA
ncbi:hypothetical protein [Sphingomonas sp.]|jgi:hypothetical protein|uniref:hypothetical protein n=1 Tax=Sphingomonas sp. TaxID=28214 RepID=UPI00260E10ED|nr:hypothetical protein [Sphingomonas sp.]